MNNRKKQLSETEIKIMKYLWRVNGPVMVSDIMQHFRQEHGKTYAASTVNTMLQRLVTAGYAERGGQYIAFSGYPYCYKISQEDYFIQQANLYEKIYSDGSPCEFILLLLRTQKISPQDMERIQKCINELKDKDGK